MAETHPFKVHPLVLQPAGVEALVLVVFKVVLQRFFTLAVYLPVQLFRAFYSTCIILIVKHIALAHYMPADRADPAGIVTYLVYPFLVVVQGIDTAVLVLYSHSSVDYSDMLGRYRLIIAIILVIGYPSSILGVLYNSSHNNRFLVDNCRGYSHQGYPRSFT